MFKSAAFEIKNMITEFDKIKNNYSIWIVANVIDTVQNFESYIKHTNFSEFFTKAEFASIASAITGIFGYVRIFYSELEFIDYVCNNKYPINNENIIVYNFARDGLYEGKKSLIPAICDLLGIKYIGSNAFVVSLLRNKFVYTKYLESLGIPVPLSALFNNSRNFDSSIFKQTDALIAKSVIESASIGMDNENIIVNWNASSIEQSLVALCKKMTTKQVIVQRFIDGSECEVFVIKRDQTYHAFLPIELVIHKEKILTTSISDDCDYSFGPLSDHFSADLCDKIMRTSETAAELLNIKNYARFDYRISDNETFFLIDISGSPYLTRHSSIAYLFTNILKLDYSTIFYLLAALAGKN